MEVIKTDIEGVVIIEPRIFKDARGYFFESFSQREFDEKVRHIDFCQDNESMSSYGVMRGLHFQRPPFTQSKLVRCVKAPYLTWLWTYAKDRPHTANMLLWNLQRTITDSSSCRAASHMASPYSAKPPFSSINATTSTILKQTVAYPFLTIRSALTGRFLQSTPSFQRKTPSMIC